MLSTLREAPFRVVMSRCFFVSDLHGRERRFALLFEKAGQERPGAIFLGGDLLPNTVAGADVEEHMDRVLFTPLSRLHGASGPPSRVFAIMGNDDPRIFEPLLEGAEKRGLLEYIHGCAVPFGDLHVAGYSYVPPTPFLLKDWERYDISRYVDIGAVSPEEGHRTVPVDASAVRYSTIREDLEALGRLSPPSSTVYLFHAPPYQTSLDRLGGSPRVVDAVPADMHVGSIAIRRFIERERPPVTLHGHIHESASVTGSWSEPIGTTRCLSAAHGGPGLCLVRFDTDRPEDASREILGE